MQSKRLEIIMCDSDLWTVQNWASVDFIYFMSNIVRDSRGCSCSLKGTLCVIYQKKAETSLSLELQAAFLYQ